MLTSWRVEFKFLYVCDIGGGGGGGGGGGPLLILDSLGIG